jgi:hypothetical protein
LTLLRSNGNERLGNSPKVPENQQFAKILAKATVFSMVFDLFTGF